MGTAATATSRRAAPSPAVLKQRRAMADELLGINIKLGPQFKRMAELEADLKKAATDAGDSFKEDFGASGYVSASGAVAAEFKGDVPLVQTEKWLGLSKAERSKLEKSGLIKVEPQYGRPTSGRVTVKVL
jgi:hypothetical protein